MLKNPILALYKDNPYLRCKWKIFINRCVSSGSNNEFFRHTLNNLPLSLGLNNNLSPEVK